MSKTKTKVKTKPIPARGTPAVPPKDNLIYQPSTDAWEYAALALNIYRGCGHGCAYCYVPRTIRMKRVNFDAYAEEKKDFMERLHRDAAECRCLGITGQVMLSFTSDPYHPYETEATRAALEVLIENGMGFCILSKGAQRAFRDRDLYRPDRDAYAATLTSLDDNFSLKWERNAPLPGDRISTLRRFHEWGIYTWVSLEPTLDCAASLAIIRATHEFVDLYKVGRANDCGALTKQTDWRGYTLEVIDLLHQLGKAHYIKESLQEYLPPGYHNPMRVPQHH